MTAKLGQELQELLAEELVEGPYDPSSPYPEKNQIDFLVEVFEGFSLGDYSYAELRAIFQRYPTGNFDLEGWLDSLIQQGHFDPDVRET